MTNTFSDKRQIEGWGFEKGQLGRKSTNTQMDFVCQNSCLHYIDTYNFTEETRESLGRSHQCLENLSNKGELIPQRELLSSEGRIFQRFSDVGKGLQCPEHTLCSCELSCLFFRLQLGTVANVERTIQGKQNSAKME